MPQIHVVSWTMVYKQIMFIQGLSSLLRHHFSGLDENNLTKIFFNNI